MRHVIAHTAVYVIATLLVGGAAAFGTVRSRQLVIVDEAMLLSRHEPATAHEFEWGDLGAYGYARNCANCHSPDGTGWDQYPPLRPIAVTFPAEAARAYLIDLHLYGLSSARWRAPMPRMHHVTDAELAAILNHVVVRFGGADAAGDRLFQPADIAARRGQGIGPRDVDRRRPAP
ncbi:MAG: cytochrome c [Gemmatimonadaceae bacterium]|nr:cytochrome c [Gemmatimonadaceae bacterium]